MAKSDAEAAYAAALEEIERVRAAGETEISFDAELFYALERIPESLADIDGLVQLDLDNTAVGDLSPLTGLTGLQGLWLSGTSVSDLSPLAALTGLQTLWLNETSVRDLSPLTALTGLQNLSLNETSVRDLSPLTTLSGLQILSLNGTFVRDLSPLAALTELQTLSLNGTSVHDLSPLTPLTGLQDLRLDGTPVIDLTPLGKLADLRSLWLDGTPVHDLRPIRSFTKLGVEAGFGLTFDGIAAAVTDAELARLSEIEDDQIRIRETLAYLNSLPPWPEPYLPAARPDGQPPQLIGEPPEPPEQVSAPLRVRDDGARWLEDVPGDGLGAPDRDRAREGWEMLREFLEDLGDLRPRLSNQMPTMSKALGRFEAALGMRYEDLQAVKLGAHGNRIIRLSAAAAETLSDEDAAELQEFAGAIALFLERFPEWRAYRTPTPEETLPPETAETLADLVQEFAEILKERPEMDPAIPASLEEQAGAVKEMPEDALAAKGLSDSTSNVIASIAEVAIKGAKACGHSLVDFIKDLSSKTREKTIAGGSTALAGAFVTAAGLLIFRSAELLRAFAATNPQANAWILELLKVLGL